VSDEVKYLSFRSSEWQPKAKTKISRREVRELLLRGDLAAEVVSRRSRMQERERQVFTADMAKAMGAWQRWAVAEAKVVFLDTQDLMSRSLEKARRKK
jgi:hypothetical protein